MILITHYLTLYQCHFVAIVTNPQLINDLDTKMAIFSRTQESNEDGWSEKL